MKGCGGFGAAGILQAFGTARAVKQKSCLRLHVLLSLLVAAGAAHVLVLPHNSPSFGSSSVSDVPVQNRRTDPSVGESQQDRPDGTHGRPRGCRCICYSR